MNPARDLVCAALRQPQSLTTLTLGEWDVLVRQARRARLLSRIASILDAQGALGAVPHAARAHLRAAALLTEAQHADLLRELAHVSAALADTDIHPILLGGSAYVAAGELSAMGRSLSDIALLVPAERIAEAEAALMAQGWTTLHHPPHERAFYRRWMAGPPPLRHVRRHSVVILRHTAQPGRIGRGLAAHTLLDATLPLEHDHRFRMLSPVDLVLCNMAELFCCDDVDGALQDLSDLDLMLRRFGQSPDFWTDLSQRAGELGVQGPMRHAVRWCGLLLGTPLAPPATLAAAAGKARIGDSLWSRALRPQHATTADRWSGLARAALHWRSLRLRMPPLSALRHLVAEARPSPANRG
jgi:hypothetical protein